jgi:ABC-type antimicrobial peptide transport system permease subunit
LRIRGRGWGSSCRRLHLRPRASTPGHCRLRSSLSAVLRICAATLRGSARTGGAEVQTFSSRIPLVVSEILDRYGASAFISIDNAFFVSLETARTLTNQRYYNLILVRADRIENVQSVVDQLTAIYGERARIIALQTLSSTISGIIGQFSVLLGSVAGISLTVAGLGIMNIMLVSVIERTNILQSDRDPVCPTAVQN